MIKGIIFDCNGTLVFDDKHNWSAWYKLFIEITNDKENALSFYENCPFGTNSQIIKRIFDTYHKQYTEEQVDKLAYHKEELYQEIVLQSNDYVLTSGAEDLFNYLKSIKMPINIATASIKYNCDFYFKQLGLDRWFNQEIIGYDDGTSPTKKEIFIKAANNIGLEVKDCLIVEDSLIPIQLAVEAGCTNIIHMNSKQKEFKIKEIIQVINDFNELDRSIFAKK